MTATLNDIKGWLRRGLTMEGCTHVIIAVDTWDFENYPVFVAEDQDVHDEIERIRESSMQRIDEVYNLSKNIDAQLNEDRAYHP